MTWDGRERREHVPLTDEDMKKLAKLAADEVFERFYHDVGRTVIHKIVRYILLALIGAYVVALSKGWVKLP